MNKLNIEHTLYSYQERDLIKVINEFKKYNKVLLTEPTGAGKTVIMSFLAKWYKYNYNKKIVILCNRTELVDQTIETIIRIGLTAEKIVSSKRSFHHSADVYVAMEQTLFNKIKNNKYFLNNVGLVIADECHYQNFAKHLDIFNSMKILGCTATPVINERETFYKCEICDEEFEENQICHNHETIEWGRPKVMNKFYESIVVGSTIPELIKFGQLVPVINFVVDSADLSKLKTDASGEYTNKSQIETFGNNKVVYDVVANYESIAKGKKTIVYTPNTKVNLQVYEEFKSKGYNVNLIDSVNKIDKSRKELFKWFDETDDAILVNANTLIAGFDNKEVQCIILDRAFSSISSYLQAVGRGGRNSQRIYKEHFILIDLGGNVNRFNSWDDDTIDWEKIFYHGIGKTKAKKESILDVKECKSCGYLMPRSEVECPECGHIPKPKELDTAISQDLAKPLDNIPYPNGEKIYQYTISRGENIHFAHKILINQIFDMFKFYQVSKEVYENTKRNGKLDAKLNQIVRKVYFVLIRKEDLEGTNRTIQEIINRIKRKLDKYYV